MQHLKWTSWNLKCTSKVRTCSIPILNHYHTSFVLEIWPISAHLFCTTITPSVPPMLESAEGVPRLTGGALWVHQRKPGISTKGVALGCSEVKWSVHLPSTREPPWAIVKYLAYLCFFWSLSRFTLIMATKKDYPDEMLIPIDGYWWKPMDYHEQPWIQGDLPSGRNRNEPKVHLCAEHVKHLTVTLTKNSTDGCLRLTGLCSVLCMLALTHIYVMIETFAIQYQLRIITCHLQTFLRWKIL